ncbi:PTS system fructose-specific IIB /IIC component [Vibrio variabilis]|uniref:protein-N(pi)-phosphohistidine--D-fructose phosphotransferase n=1 Tax=Vibrio variabilis TaxID=990271 RepID=A0ABQ0JFW8_9VIBR|nr:PTS system fructose-specific IIB /IIC component [Vibrio variabilis]
MPSGVANSIIAAGLLDQAAKALGHEANVECHSSVVETQMLSDAQISEADVIVIAANTPVDTQRFVGKKVYQASISECTSDPKAFLTDAIEKATELEQGVAVASAPEQSANGAKKIVAITACLLAWHTLSWQRKR